MAPIPIPNASAPTPHASELLLNHFTKRYTIKLTTPPAPQFAYLNSVFSLPAYQYISAQANKTFHNLLRRFHPSTTTTTTNTLASTLHSLSKRTLSNLHPRQNRPEIAIPTVYAGLNAGPAPGTVVGIVLGSVVGFVLIVWLLFFLSQNSRASIEGESVYIERRRSRSPRSRSSRHTRSRRSEIREVSRSPRRERVVVEERRREVSAAPPPVIVREERREERRVEGDDVIEVMEETSDVTPEIQSTPRRKSSGARRSSGYRSVDPNQYGGGGYEQREVYGSRGSRRY
jgi:hypothetical protein